MGRGRIASTVSAITLNTAQYEFINIDMCLKGRINNPKHLLSQTASVANMDHLNLQKLYALQAIQTYM